MSSPDQTSTTASGTNPRPLSQLALSVAIPVALFLLVPLIAMQFTAEVNWTLSDFIFAFIILFSAGFTYRLVTRTSSDTTYRIAVGFAVISALLLVWINMAVGIIGSEDNPFNAAYFGVLFVGIIGSLFVRFQAKGMTHVLGIVTLVLVGITIFAFIQGMHLIQGSSIYQVLAVNGFFIMLSLVTAIAFHHASKKQPLLP